MIGNLFIDKLTKKAYAKSKDTKAKKHKEEEEEEEEDSEEVEVKKEEGVNTRLKDYLRKQVAFERTKPKSFYVVLRSLHRSPAAKNKPNLTNPSLYQRYAYSYILAI